MHADVEVTSFLASLLLDNNAIYPRRLSYNSKLMFVDLPDGQSRFHVASKFVPALMPIECAMKNKIETTNLPLITIMSYMT